MDFFPSPTRASLIVDTNLEDLTPLLQWFIQFRDDLGDEMVWLQCEIALVEIFTNVVRHAHKHLPPETPIQIDLALTPQLLELRVWDYGQPFDMKNHMKQLPDRINPDQEGGRGLFIIKEVADTLSYDRHGAKNCFVITKKLTPHHHDRIL